MALTDEVFALNKDEREMAFEELYLIKFGRLAHPQREAARLDVLQKIKDNEDLTTEFLSGILKEADKNDVLKNVVIKGANVVSDAGMAHALNAFVSKEIIKATVKGGADQLGRRGAVVVIEQGGGLAAAQGAHAAFNGVKMAGKMGALFPSISSVIGQSIAEKVTEECGITNYHAKNCIAVGGAVGGGAAAGFMVGGPPGAAAGAAIGVVSWGIGKTFDALYTSGLGIKGPKDNMAYIKTGQLKGQICFGTYGSSDTMYWKTYWNEYRKSNCDMFEMSAGQGQEKSFQLCIWDDKNAVVKHFNEVYYRDFIHVGTKEGHICVAHGKGEKWGSAAGSIDV